MTTKRELPPVPEAERHQHSGCHPVGSQPADSQLAGSRPVDSRLALQDRQVTERSAPEVDPQPSGNRQEKSRGSYLPKEKRPALRGSSEKLSKNGYFHAKPEFIIGNYVIARETARLAIKEPIIELF